MTVEDFKQKTSIVSVLESKGLLVPKTKKPSIKCPFHKDGNPSFSIDIEKGVWFCHAGCGGGSVIDLLAKFDGTDGIAAIKKYVPSDENYKEPAQPAKATISKIYSYQDENGKELYQSLRYIPKTFRQRTQVNGEWIWKMEGVRRVPYHLPEVLKAQQVWIVEGEKDADNLRELGYVATCNVGGAGKWLDSYSEFFVGKEVILCGDNDKPGEEHIDKVCSSLSPVAKNVRQIRFSGDFKDASDFIAAYKDQTEAKAALDSLIAGAPILIKGVHLPIKSISELEDTYRKHVADIRKNQLDLGNWIPSFRGHVRGLVPGELVTIVANTGVGKTALLQNISKHCAPLPTVLFEMELPDELLYERYLGVHAGWTESTIRQLFEDSIRAGEKLGEIENLKHVYVCTESKLTPDELEHYINRAELKIGERPKVVLLDYIQLMQGKGNSRYERASNVAERLKIIAKACRVVLIVASQISRPDGESPEVGLHDAKDSGSIENSSGLVLGAWRDKDDKSTLYLRILKNTKGSSGHTVTCNFKGDSMQINERAKTIENPDYMKGAKND